MKLILINCLIISSLFAAMQISAEETSSEKVEATVNTGKRSAKKAMNRTKEALCGKLTGDNKVQCLAKQAENRIIESADAVKDKATELKNNVDTDIKK